MAFKCYLRANLSETEMKLKQMKHTTFAKAFLKKTIIELKNTK